MSATGLVADGQRAADEVLRQVLLTQPHTHRVVVDSPPGAGKTGVAERLAVQAMAVHEERCMVSTQTNAQALDVCSRVAAGWPRLPFHLFVRADLDVSDVEDAFPNVTVITSVAEMPDGPCVVIGNSVKWSYLRDWEDKVFDLMIVDEAYQLREAVYAQIEPLAHRHVLVGDPGQINPVTKGDVTRWLADQAGPHVPCPQALLARAHDPQAREFGAVARLALPVSRRLPADTVDLVAPAFYPGLPFTATSRPEDRALIAGPPVTGDGTDRLIDLAAEGATLALAQLDEKVTGEFDPDLSAAIVQTVVRLLERDARVVDYDGQRPLDASMIGVVCGHRSQVHAVQERLPDGLGGVLVETSDRFQGLERKVMLVHHPLSGRADVSEFHLDAGRLCVMASRHRICCMLFARVGLRDRIRQHTPPARRVLGVPVDVVHEGRRAHLGLLDDLHERGRVVAVSA